MGSRDVHVIARVTRLALLSVLISPLIIYCLSIYRFAPILDSSSPDTSTPRLVLNVAPAQLREADGTYEWQTVPPAVHTAIYDILHNTRTTKTLRYVCRSDRERPHPCGGLSDRLKGVQALLHFATATGRRLEIDASVFHAPATADPRSADVQFLMNGLCQPEAARVILSSADDIISVQSNCITERPSKSVNGSISEHDKVLSGQYQEYLTYR